MLSSCASSRVGHSVWLQRFFLALLGGTLLLGGCDASVEAVAPTDRYHYSVFGVLDPVKDTQWVRIEPLPPPTAEGAPRSLGVTVTLENQATGQLWTLRDSVVEIHSGEPQHNFWTTAPVEPSTSYRLVVSAEDGDSATATTTTPARAPTIRVGGAIYLPCLPRSPNANTFSVEVRDVEAVAALRVRYFQGPLHYDFDWYDEMTRRSGAYSATVSYLKDLRTIRTFERLCDADSAQVITASAGPDWPDWAEYHGASLGEVARPDSFTNVQGGLGMLSGVYSDTARVEVRSRGGR